MKINILVILSAVPISSMSFLSSGKYSETHVKIVNENTNIDKQPWCGVNNCPAGPEIGDTLRCYSCSSLNNAACADPPNVTQMEVTECGPLIKNAVCSKRTTKTPQLTFTGRRCLSEDICDYALNLDQLSEQCDTCTTDLCNSSPHLTSIYSVIFLGSIFSLLKVLLLLKWTPG